MTFFQSLIGVISSSGAGGAPLDITTVGGTRNVVGIYSYHTWTSNDTFTLNTAADRDIEFCIIGGGGSAGKCQGGTSQPGGGAGAGEQVYGTYSSMPAGTWNAVIGAGGASVPGSGNPQTWMYGNNGSQTYSSQTSGSGGDQLRASGGGAGTTFQNFSYYYNGVPGGCGGGASAIYGNGGIGGPAYPYPSNPAWTTSRSTAGGNGSYNSAATAQGGGGGGIGGVGGHASNLVPWNFYAAPISGGPAGVGAYHALTAGSSTIASTTGVGGAAGGGDGGCGATAPSGVAASNTGASASAPANSGSGSSSAQENSVTGAGGSGYVIIRWVTLV
jgi:hypothetical protein